jgi:hypothetical protein
MAFYSKNSETKELVVFGAGEPIFRLHIAEKVCLNDWCGSKADFIATYISEEFPENSFDEILEARPIAVKGSQITKTVDGFEQIAHGKHYDIDYKADKYGVVFIEKISKIIIKIKEVEE